jgi:hypothetical protein
MGIEKMIELQKTLKNLCEFSNGQGAKDRPPAG